MPKPSDYTPTRRYIMQAVMALILAATIALAAAVSSRARRANRVELSNDAPVTARQVTVRLPQGWRAQPTDAKDPGLVVEAVEHLEADDEEEDADGGTARTVTVRVEHLSTPQSPLQCLLSNFGHLISSRRPQRTEDWFAPIAIAGHPGMMMTAEQGSRRRGGGTTRKDVVAAAVLPSLRAVTIHLQGVGEADANDHAVVQAIAAALTLAGEPALGKPGEVVTLADGIRFTAPRGFVPVAADVDAARTDRRLWTAPRRDTPESLDEMEGAWFTIETVGCLCLDFDAADPKQAERAKSTLATLLLVRDPRWQGAPITPMGDKVWRADPPGAEAGERGVSLYARAFLMTHPSGRALLTIVRGGLAKHDLESPWRDLAPTVQFLPASDVATLEDLGASEAARLRRAGYEKLLPDRDIAWWRWLEGDAYVGWSNLDFPVARPGGSAPGLAAKGQHHLRLPNGVDHVTHDFTYRDGVERYTSTVIREQIQRHARGTFTQKTTLADGKLAMTVQPPDGPAVQRWNDLAPPPQFVPGGLLPLVLPRLARDPMILVTDTFPGREGLGPPQPLTLIIRPGDGATTTRAGDALQCVTVEVNGTGVVSRWYFRKTGELERVDWGAGLQQLASDESAVKNTFPKGNELAP